jgi:hypothetical protein
VPPFLKSSHKQHLACTSYCNCSGLDRCCNSIPVPATAQGPPAPPDLVDVIKLWKAADSPAPPNVLSELTHFGWIIQDSIPVPATAQGPPAPPDLVDVIKCHCKAQGTQCSTEACSCHKQHLACTSYCSCSGLDRCCNPHSKKNPSAEKEQSDTEKGDDDEGGDDEIVVSKFDFKVNF